jgi:hypothetical protein
MDRKQGIAELSDLIERDKMHYTTFFIDEKKYRHLVFGTWDNLYIDTVYTTTLCQVFECKYNADNEEDPKHQHTGSQETFYQLCGTSTFSDGTVLLPGQTHIIPPDTPHKVSLSKDGKCIIIIHPPLPRLQLHLISGA